jgi:2-phosphosulfolactate phosphatase
VEIRHALGIEGARAARGVVIVIDVLRSFTLSAYALAGGARECLLVVTVDEARALASRIPDAVISAEVNTRPVAGIAISNSPTQIKHTDVSGRTVVQRSSAGTPVINAVPDGHDIFASGLVVARATARACRSKQPDAVTIVASADFPEDHACGRYIAAELREENVNLNQLLKPLFASERYRRFAQGDWPGFPKTDLELALAADRFDFAMPATRESGHVRLTAHEQKQRPKSSFGR